MTPPTPAVSSWSLHRTLGQHPNYGPEQGERVPAQQQALALLELPAHLREHGFDVLELCHFHLLSRDEAYLGELRSALRDANVTLSTLLIDGGDLTHPHDAPRERDWIAGWFAVAASLGVRCVRVIAGRAAPSTETLAQSRAGLQVLAEHARAHGLRLLTENGFSLLLRPEHVLGLLDSLAGELGLCADFGNWRGPDKYQDLAAIMPHAETCHAKCSFNAALEPDQNDFTRCLTLARDAGFAGPYTLIYDGPNEAEWRGLAQERELVMASG